MLDWTTSFLSDETIIKLRLGFCQIVSIGPLGVVAHRRSITMGGTPGIKKAPPFERGF
jgi:hypothetical protein